jgi:hypothetical protein
MLFLLLLADYGDEGLAHVKPAEMSAKYQWNGVILLLTFAASLVAQP